MENEGALGAILVLLKSTKTKLLGQGYIILVYATALQKPVI